MTKSFSLLDEAWLPVATSTGDRELVRLCDISRPDLVAIATGRPDCDISLTEFLVGLVAVARPPEDVRDWRAGFSTAPTAEQLQAAFTPLADALMLDGEGPRFFQDRQDLQGEPTEVEALCMDVVAKHFTKPGRIQVLSRAGAAIALATLQTSSPSGGAGHRTSLRGGGPLTTLVVPGAPSDEPWKLWRLLWANLPLTREDKPDLKRVFPWLAPTRVSDKSGVATAPFDVDPMQAFFGMPRRVRLVFESNNDKRSCDLLGIVDDIAVTHYVTRPWGTNYEGWSRGHPLSPYYKAKAADTVLLPVHLKSSRVGYREWLGMAVGEADESRVPAQCVFDFRRRLKTAKGELDVVRRDARMLVAGYAMDNMKPLDFAESLMPLLVGSTDAVNGLVKRIANQLIDAAEEVASLLVTSVKIGLYGDGAKVDAGSTVLQPIRDRFWADTETVFFDTLSAALERFDALADGDTDALQDGDGEIAAKISAEWLAAMRRHAERIFDESVSLDDTDSRRIADVVKARRQLQLSLAGYGAVGKRICKALGMPEPAKSDKKAKPSKDRKERAT